MSDTLATIKRRYASRPGDVTHLIALAEQAEAQLRDVTAERERLRAALGIYADRASWSATMARNGLFVSTWDREEPPTEIALAALAPTPPTAPERGED
jgi:hypothetical protein